MHSQTTEYALRAMICLATRPAQLVSTSVLSEQTKAPSDYLAKVLQMLSGEKLIDSRRGVGGGYRLARGPDSITVLDVINAVQGAEERCFRCPVGVGANGGELCALHKLTDRASRALTDIYGGCSLSDLLTNGSARPALCTMERAS